MKERTPDDLRQKAREILVEAERTHDADNRATLLRMAASYIQMARQLEDMAQPRAGRWDMAQQQPAQQAQGRSKA